MHQGGVAGLTHSRVKPDIGDERVRVVVNVDLPEE
jgi:hypothetical protein